MEKNLDYLFNDVPLYTKEEFKVFELKDDKYELNEEELKEFIKYIGFNQEKIITYCHKCEMTFPFKVKRKCIEIDQFENVMFSMDITSDIHIPGALSRSASVELTDGTIHGPQPPYDKDKLLNNKIHYVEYYLTCTNSDKHNYLLMITVEIRNGKFIVRKIGQNPSMLTVKGFDFDKYKDILEKLNAYDDYKKADLCNADHFHVGGYAYLRRIFEKMINFYLDGKVLKDNHMSTKIEEVKEKFDPRIRELLKNMYGILSKGVHELEEEESKQYYSYLKTIIDMQLEFMSTETEKEKQTEELKKEIGKIANLVNNK